MNQILQQPQESQELDLAVRPQLQVLVTPKAALERVQVLLSALEESLAQVKPVELVLEE